MQRKKNISLLISFLVLSIACVAIYWQGRSGSTLDVNENLFRLENYEDIDRISLKSPDGEVELQYKDNRWQVNRQFPADRNLIDVLFATLQQAIPKRPVAERLRDSVSYALDKDGVRVSLFSGDELRQEFIAGGNEQKTQAYIKEVDGAPYLVVIPGYRVYVSGILELDEKGWRDKYIFGFNWQNFKRLVAVFPDDHRKDFNIVMKDRAPFLEGVANADTSRLYTFIDDVSLLTADEFVANEDSLVHGNPLMKIEIEDVASRIYTLDIYPRSPQSNQFPGMVYGTDLALFAEEKIRRMLKSKEYFRGDFPEN